MTVFALVHGAWHGAWCWDRLISHVQEAGHHVVTVDLPSDDPAKSFSDYADVVVRALDDVDEEPVLVGHSLAGVTVPLVAARRPVRRLVYLCSLLPAPGISLADRIRSTPDMLIAGYQAGLTRVDELGTTRWVDERLAHETFYGDCDPAASRWAFSRLRPQATKGYLDPWPLDALPEVPSTYIVCNEDALVNPEWSHRAATTELGADVVELPGGHSPFLSRPAELARTLTSL